jgi:hypothetical protein
MMAVLLKPHVVGMRMRGKWRHRLAQVALPVQRAQQTFLRAIYMIQNLIHHQAQILVLEWLDAIHPPDRPRLGGLALQAQEVANSKLWLPSNHVNI